jgi:hypothetical protein
MAEELLPPEQYEYRGKLPVVEIDPKLTSPKSKCYVDFDTKKFANLLAGMGVPQQEIERTRVVVASQGSGLFAAQYKKDKHEITINAGAMLKEYEKLSQRVREIISGSKKKRSIEPLSFPILTTTRLPGYLRSKAPPERKRMFAKRLLLQAIQRKLFALAIHEVKHLYDHTTNPKKFKREQLVSGMKAGLGCAAFMLAQETALAAILHGKGFDYEFNIIRMLFEQTLGTIWAYVVVYEYFDPLEKRARKFEEIMENRFRDWNFIKVEPRDASTKQMLSRPWGEIKDTLS